MKKGLLGIFLILSNYSISQYIEEAIEINQPQTFTIGKATGNSRQVIPIKLPPRTIKWFYTFSASRNKADIEKTAETFNLFSKLSLIIDQSGSTANALSLIGKPPGTDNCDVYLLSSENDVSLFEKRTDNNIFSLSQWTCIREGTREGLISGTIDITNARQIKGTQYLGFRNKSIFYNVNICIQVVAIVEKDITTNGWTKQQKDELYKYIKTAFSKNIVSKTLGQNTIDSLIACVLTKLTNTYTRSKLLSFAEYEMNSALNIIVSECKKELNFTSDVQLDKIGDDTYIKAKLIGKWKDENSTFTLLKNGICSIQMDNGQIANGKWDVLEGVFKFNIDNSNKYIEHRILTVSETKFQFKAINGNEIYNAIKIE
ncbi:MAG: hypothetical protein NTZ59_12320 [Bacteroidetes bacterium]|nr:hypothetical protein [Bacteroidota bacterium]